MKSLAAISLVAFLLMSHSALAEWRGTVNFYAEPTAYTATMPDGQLLSFGNPIVFTYWKKEADSSQRGGIRYKGIAQAIAVEGTRRMHVHVFFSRPEAKKAEGELDLEWMEKSVVKTAPWWKFWAW